jgi:integrase
MKLSDKAVQAARAKEKMYKLSDGNGLYLHVLPSGVKSWRLKYRFKGTEKTMTFGLYPIVTLKEAREGSFAARKILSDGKDPIQVKRDEQRGLDAADAVSFEKIMAELLEAKAKRASYNHVNDYRRSMELHVLGKFGQRDIKSISAIEIIDLGKKIESSGRYLAHRIIQRIGEVMDFAVATGRREQNPVTKMTHSTLSPHTRENNPAISMAELPDFLRDLARYRGFPITIALLKFVMLTACRTGEARDLIWDWVDWEKKLITIPPSGYKTGRKHINQGKTDATPHLIPLSNQVIELLNEAKEITKNKGDQYVFPRYRNYAGQASENAVSSALANIEGGKWKGRQSGHGFRRLARTAWGDHGGWSFEAMERQLAHSIGDNTVSAYDKSERIDERARMLQWWADRVDQARQGTDILPH